MKPVQSGSTSASVCCAAPRPSRKPGTAVGCTWASAPNSDTDGRRALRTGRQRLRALARTRPRGAKPRAGRAAVCRAFAARRRRGVLRLRRRAHPPMLARRAAGLGCPEQCREAAAPATAVPPRRASQGLIAALRSRPCQAPAMKAIEACRRCPGAGSAGTHATERARESRQRVLLCVKSGGALFEVGARGASGGAHFASVEVLGRWRNRRSPLWPCAWPALEGTPLTVRPLAVRARAAAPVRCAWTARRACGGRRGRRVRGHGRVGGGDAGVGGARALTLFDEQRCTAPRASCRVGRRRPPGASLRPRRRCLAPDAVANRLPASQRLSGPPAGFHARDAPHRIVAGVRVGRPLGVSVCGVDGGCGGRAGGAREGLGSPRGAGCFAPPPPPPPPLAFEALHRHHHLPHDLEAPLLRCTVLPLHDDRRQLLPVYSLGPCCCSWCKQQVCL
jgi:hypothetical protein